MLFNTKNEPNAAKLIESLRYLGYNNYSAICDLIDNSIDADAQNIRISISQRKGDYIISIADDGTGMDLATLDEAMKLGSLVDRDVAADLGKFGMGLVTSSLSIAQRTEVVTRFNGEFLTSVTDVEEVRKRNEFCKYLGKASPENISEFKKLVGDSTGTVVELSNSDNFKNKNVSVFANTLRNKVGQIYRMFLASGRKIFINQKEVNSIDPMMLDNPKTELFCDDSISLSLKSLDGKDIAEQIRLRIVVLPEFSRDLEKSLGVSQKHQGFYLLRNNREIASGQTLDIFTRHNDLNRFRAEIFFSATLDEFMGVNFTKHQVDLHQAITDKIREFSIGQIRTIRSRIKTKQVAKEDREVSHEESERAISAKSRLLIKPKPKTQAKVVGVKKKTGARVERNHRDGTDGRPSRVRTSVKFMAASLGLSGPIYEAEQENFTILIRWNIDHPFYQRFILERKNDKTLLTSVDFLIYSMATAELTALNDENFELIQTIKSVMSANMRSLLS